MKPLGLLSTDGEAMENVSASTETYENEVSVSKSFTSNFVSTCENGGLRPLPYMLDIKKGTKTRMRVVKKQYNCYWFDIAPYDDLTGVYHWVSPGNWSPEIGSTVMSSTGKSIISWLGDPSYWSETGAALQKMQNGLLAKIQGQSLPVLMALKERKQTASLIRDTIQRLYNGVRLVRHPKQMFKALRGRTPTALELRRLRKVERRLLKRKLRQNRDHTLPKFRVEQAFLEYRFAWLPLVKDVQDMLDGMANTLKHSVTKSARKGINFSLSKQPSLNAFWTQVDPGLETDCGVSVVGHAKVFYMIDDASLAMLSQCQGVAATMYDNVPYSFLADGLVNISKYLDLLDATMGLRFTDGYITTLTRSYAKVTGTPWFRSSSQGDISGSDGTVLYKFDIPLGSTSVHLSMNRQILTSFPTPSLEYPYRDFITVQRVADIGALLIQAGRKLF